MNRYLYLLVSLLAIQHMQASRPAAGPAAGSAKAVELKPTDKEAAAKFEELLKYLQEYEEEVYQEYIKSDRDWRQPKILVYAAQQGYLPLVNALLGAGVQPEETINWPPGHAGGEEIALKIAREFKKYDIPLDEDELRETKFDRRQHSLTNLGFAIDRALPGLVAYLLEQGADFSKLHAGQNPLQRAQTMLQEDEVDYAGGLQLKEVEKKKGRWTDELEDDLVSTYRRKQRRAKIVDMLVKAQEQKRRAGSKK